MKTYKPFNFQMDSSPSASPVSLPETDFLGLSPTPPETSPYPQAKCAKRAHDGDQTQVGYIWLDYMFRCLNFMF